MRAFLLVSLLGCTGKPEGECTAGSWFPDADGDGYGTAAGSVEACAAPAGHVADATDCDDTMASASPGAMEACDGVDNDCDGDTDEGVRLTWYTDADGDGQGAAGTAVEACEATDGRVSNEDDCDDGEAAVYLGAAELCNGVDDDCDGVVDEDVPGDAPTWYADVDGDGYGDATAATDACAAPDGYVAEGTDCDDLRGTVRPGAAELCNGVDDDCDGAVDDDAADPTTWHADVDGDGYGDASTAVVACDAPDGHVTDATDCVDTDATTWPDAPELCDGADNDCDTIEDDTVTYADVDGDGLGDADAAATECTSTDHVLNAYDCDDTDPSEPVVTDAVNGSATGAGTLVDPYVTLQAAVDAASRCVIAYPGTYAESVDVHGSLDVWGVEGHAATIIDPALSTCTTAAPSTCAPAVTIATESGATPHLHGFTITGGTGSGSSASSRVDCKDSGGGARMCTITTWSYCGGGVYVDGDHPTFTDVDIRDNVLPIFEQVTTGPFAQTWMYSFGGGACVASGSATFDDSWITGNYADQGGGLYGEGAAVLTFTHGHISQNSASDGGGITLAGASARLTNAAVSCNDASIDGGGLFTETSGAATFVNTALFGNTSSTSGDARGSQAWIGADTTFDLTNSIVEGATLVALLYGAGSGTHDYDNTSNSAGERYGGTLVAGVGALSSGGNFTAVACDGDAYNDDYTLVGGSVSIDAGDPAVLDGDGSRGDLGVFGGPEGSW